MKIDTSDIINIRSLFKNTKYNTEQSKKYWKQQHRDDILEYHKNYNTEHKVSAKMAGFCHHCCKQYANLRQHYSSKLHYRNV